LIKKNTAIKYGMDKLKTPRFRYNVKTAKKLVSRLRLRLPFNDCSSFFEADLLETRSGKYFLYGKGGIVSLFRGAKTDTILPISDNEAFELCQEYMTKKDFAEKFPTGK
jgi:hypothetical protein